MLKLKNSNNIAATTLRDSCDRMAAKSAARPNFVSPRYCCALPPDYLLLLRNMLQLLHVTNIEHDTCHMLHHQVPACHHLLHCRGAAGGHRGLVPRPPARYDMT